MEHIKTSANCNKGTFVNAFLKFKEAKRVRIIIYTNGVKENGTMFPSIFNVVECSPEDAIVRKTVRRYILKHVELYFNNKDYWFTFDDCSN